MVDPEISRGKRWPVRLKPREKEMYYSTDGMDLPKTVLANARARRAPPFLTSAKSMSIASAFDTQAMIVKNSTAKPNNRCTTRPLIGLKAKRVTVPSHALGSVW